MLMTDWARFVGGGETRSFGMALHDYEAVEVIRRIAKEGGHGAAQEACRNTPTQAL